MASTKAIMTAARLRVIAGELNDLADDITSGEKRTYYLNLEEEFRAWKTNPVKKPHKELRQMLRDGGFEWCPACKTPKPFYDFGKDRSRTTGFGKYCRECRSEMGAAKREAKMEASRPF